MIPSLAKAFGGFQVHLEPVEVFLEPFHLMRFKVTRIAKFKRSLENAQ
jgi:hypothetical protein